MPKIATLLSVGCELVIDLIDCKNLMNVLATHRELQ